jgi:hypothetical protein
LKVILHRDAGARAEKDFAIFGLIAKAGGKIDRSARRGVVKPTFETDHTDSGVAERDTDAKSEAVAQTFPLRT